MKDELINRIKNAPVSPGVYIMKDRHGRVIYVGKANNIRNRVKAYFSKTDSRFMIPFLVSQVHDVEFIITETEKEALILENNLIKEHRPRYNVIFRDDKTYFNIRINLNDSFPRFQLIRRPKKDGARYFGPYPSSAAAKETLRFIQSIFPLRACGDQELKGRKRPCLEYEIKRCLAPCVGFIDELSYQRLVNDSMAFMEGREKTLIADLHVRMDAASGQLRFEEAASLRDRIAAIKETLEKQRVVSMSFKDQDVFGIYREGNLTQICMLYVRKGKIIGKKAFPLFKIGSASSEILSSVLKQYYDGEVYIPDEIIISENIEDHAVVEEWLSDKKSKGVSLIVPKRGPGKELVRIVESNAESMFEAEKHATDMRETLSTLAGVLKLRNIPTRIECFDISNIGGKYAVGSMVTFVEGRPLKAGYRRFKIRTVEGADDYAMMYEVLTRRYMRKDNVPDLIVVDGGKGQLGVAVTVMKDLNIEGVDVIGLAKEGRGMDADKGEDRVYLVGKKNPVYISRWPDILFLLQRVRDEAHRFAVTYYRKVKNKKDFQSVLDSIPGIGASKKRALLEHFGDIRKIREAPVEALQTVDGIGRQMSERICAFLREQEGKKEE